MENCCNYRRLIEQQIRVARQSPSNALHAAALSWRNKVGVVETLSTSTNLAVLSNCNEMNGLLTLLHNALLSLNANLLYHHHHHQHHHFVYRQQPMDMAATRPKLRVQQQ